MNSIKPLTVLRKINTFLAIKGFFDFLPDSVFLKMRYRLCMGHPLNLDKPKTFTEKIQWLKIHNRKHEQTLMVDKVLAKKYVASKIGEEYIVPTIGVWESADEINFDELPDQFVLKCNHDSGGVVICKDKGELNKTAAVNKLNRAMKRNSYRAAREWPYKNVDVYGILGILAAFAGLSFGTLNSSPLFNFAIALLFVIMSLAMAGVFNIDLAKYRFNPAGMNFSRDMTALFMGGISALLAGACVAPVVISVLLFAAKANWYGAFVPLALGIGMGLPWPLAGAGLSILPKPGKFMVVMKYIFALIIFAAAIYYTVLGVKLLPAGDAAAQIDGFAALEAAKAESLRTGKPVLVKFTASWCKNCHAMEKTTLRDPEVSDFIKENFIMTTFPAENPEEPGIAKLLKEYDIPGFPALVILKNVPER